MRKYIAIVFALLVMSAAGLAQVPTSGNVYFGYSFFRGSTGVRDTRNLNGWEATVEGKLFPFVGIAVDVGAQYGKLGYPALGDVTIREQSYLFGPRVSFPAGKFRPFAQVLIGVAHVHESAFDFSGSGTDFADSIGGGVDYSLIPRVSWRVQAESLQTRFHGSRQDNARISTGLVVKF